VGTLGGTGCGRLYGRDGADPRSCARLTPLAAESTVDGSLDSEVAGASSKEPVDRSDPVGSGCIEARTTVPGRRADGTAPSACGSAYGGVEQNAALSGRSESGC
jgi:hypothetical protein